MWAKAHGLLRHNHIFNVITEKSGYDIKCLVMMQKAGGGGFWATLIGHVDRVTVK